MTVTAKIFQHGRSQAVRLPKDFRLPGKEVRVSRIGDAVLLEPMNKPEPCGAEALWAKIDALRGDEDFPEVTDIDVRPGLDEAAEFD